MEASQVRGRPFPRMHLGSDGGGSAAAPKAPTRTTVGFQGLRLDWAGTTAGCLLLLYLLPASLFALAEVTALAALRASVFVFLTAPAFEQGDRYATVTEVHIWASVAMWVLATEQILCRSLRQNPQTAWMHRRAGQVMLGLFYTVVLPTSLYLSLFQRILVLAPLVAGVLMDTMFCTSYFLYRGWCVARRRATESSFAVHGCLMQCGLMMSMAIVPQRYFQLLLTGLREVLLWAGGHGWPILGWAASEVLSHQTNYTISVLATSLLFFLTGHFLDGPRGAVWQACIPAHHAEEAYGSAAAPPLERWAWRLRWLAYVVLHRAVRLVYEQDPGGAPTVLEGALR